MCLPLCQEMAVLFRKRFQRTVRCTDIGYYFLSQQGCVMRHSCYSGTNIANKKKEKKTLKDLCSLTVGWMNQADAALLSDPYHSFTNDLQISCQLSKVPVMLSKVNAMDKWIWIKMIVGHLPQEVQTCPILHFEDMCETLFLHVLPERPNVNKEPNTSSTNTITDHHNF